MTASGPRDPGLRTQAGLLSCLPPVGTLLPSPRSPLLSSCSPAPAMCLCCPADWEQHGSGCDLCGLRGRGCFQEKKGERDRVCERARACVCVCVCMDTSPERDSYYLEGPLWSERERIFPEKIKDSVCVCVCVCVGVCMCTCVCTHRHITRKRLLLPGRPSVV